MARSSRIGRVAAAHGYQRIPGRAERFRNLATGEIKSRRQVENLAFQEAGFTSVSHYRRTKRERNQKFQRFVTYAADKERGQREFDPALLFRPGALRHKLEAPESEFMRLYAAAEAAGWEKDPRPNGPFAKLLVYLDLRSEDDTHNVGDTPRTNGSVAA